MTTPTTNPARQLLRNSQLPIVKLAPMIGVSRQAYHKWLRGKTITGKHLAILEKLLQEYPEPEEITLTYECMAISFTCQCGTSLTLKRRTGASASGIFCQRCHKHYWIGWQEGILRNGKAILT